MCVPLDERVDSFIEVNRVSRADQLISPTNILKNLPVASGTEESSKIGVNNLGNRIKKRSSND